MFSGLPEKAAPTGSGRLNSEQHAPLQELHDAPI